MELIESKVYVLVAPVPSAIRTAKQETNTIPVIIVTGIDPVASGWIASLARPGGKYYWRIHAFPGVKRKEAGITNRSGAEAISSRSPLDATGSGGEQ